MLVGCRSDCTFVKDDTQSCQNTTELDLRRISRANDLYLLRVKNDFEGGVLNLTQDLQTVFETQSRLDMLDLPNARWTYGSDHVLLAFGRCVNGADLNEENKVALRFDLGSNYSFILPGLTEEGFGCCDVAGEDETKRDYCENAIDMASRDFCADYPNGCTVEEMRRIGLNLTFTSHHKTMMRSNQNSTTTSGSINGGGIWMENEHLNRFKNGEPIYERMTYLSKLSFCCSTKIFKWINSVCTEGFHWDLKPNDASLLTRTSGSEYESDVGFETMVFEDYSLDHDINDAVYRHRKSCVHRMFWNSTRSSFSNEVKTTNCYSMLDLLARGGGYDNQLYLTMDSEIDPNLFPSPRSPKTECLLLDELSALPPNKILTSNEVYKPLSSSSSSSSSPLEGGSPLSVYGNVLIQRNVKPWIQRDDLVYPYDKTTTTFLDSECWDIHGSVSSSSSFETPLEYETVNQKCSAREHGLDFLVVPSIRNQLISKQPNSNDLENNNNNNADRVESYPNTKIPENDYENTIADANYYLNETYHRHEKSSYQAVVYWNYLYPESMMFPLDETLKTVPRLRYYLKNLDCKQNVELFEVDKDYLTLDGKPWAFTIPLSWWWMWPQEGIPLALSPDKMGQCMFGQRPGLECDDDLDNECPYSTCLSRFQKICLETDVTQGINNRSDRICTRVSQCPYGRDCYTRKRYCSKDILTRNETCNQRGGSYPNVLNYIECRKSNCYDEDLIDRNLFVLGSIENNRIRNASNSDRCENLNCYDSNVLNWKSDPNPFVSTHLYPPNLKDYLGYDFYLFF